MRTLAVLTPAVFLAGFFSVACSESEVENDAGSDDGAESPGGSSGDGDGDGESGDGDASKTSCVPLGIYRVTREQDDWRFEPLAWADDANTVSVYLGIGFLNGEPFPYQHHVEAGRMVSRVESRPLLVPGDIDGNGVEDLVGFISGDLVENIIGYYPDGAGVWVELFRTPPGYQGTLAVADVNGDDFPDILSGHAGALGVFLNNGSGEFTSGASYEPGGPEGLAYVSVWSQILDLNGDGALDYAATLSTTFCKQGQCRGDFLSVRLGMGDGTFGEESQYSFSTNENVLHVALGDFDRDGFVDAAYGADARASWLRGKPGGTFAGTEVLEEDVRDAEFFTSDVNGDGFADLSFKTHDGNDEARVAFDLSDLSGGLDSLSVPVDPHSLVDIYAGPEAEGLLVAATGPAVGRNEDGSCPWECEDHTDCGADRPLCFNGACEASLDCLGNVGGAGGATSCP